MLMIHTYKQGIWIGYAFLERGLDKLWRCKATPISKRRPYHFYVLLKTHHSVLFVQRNQLTLPFLFSVTLINFSGAPHSGQNGISSYGTFMSFARQSSCELRHHRYTFLDDSADYIGKAHIRLEYDKPSLCHIQPPKTHYPHS